MEINRKLLNWVIGLGLLFPLFFQFSGAIYSGFLNDSGGNIARLPFPLAALACFGGIVLYRKRFRNAQIAWAFIAAMLLIQLFSVLFAGSGWKVEIRKLMLLAQFLMPMAALALGQMLNDDDQIIPKAFLVVLLVVVPAQLLAGWAQGTLTLTHNLYVFSIYQHLQFVPVVFVCAFVVATTALWDSHRRALLILVPLITLYAIASGSFLTIAAFIAFLAAFIGHVARADKRLPGYLVPVVALAVIVFATFAGGTYLNAAKDNTSIKGDYGAYLAKFKVLSEGGLPSNASERWADWSLFGSGIMESPRTMVLGHAAPIDRAVKSSAHNWYIDIVYSFGLVSLLPVFLLIGYTAHLIWRARSHLTLDTRWLAFVVLFLVVIDSNFKVTLRQPYPGIFSYFLWGLLLTRLGDSCRDYRANE